MKRSARPSPPAGFQRWPRSPPASAAPAVTSSAASGDAAEEVTAGAALAGGERGQRWKPAGGEGRALRFIQVRLDDQERGHPRGAKLLEVRRQVGHAGVEEARAANVDVGRELVAFGVLEQQADVLGGAERLAEAFSPAQLVARVQHLLAAEGERLA